MAGELMMHRNVNSVLFFQRWQRKKIFSFRLTGKLERNVRMKIEEQIHLNIDEKIYLVKKYKSRCSLGKNRYFYNIVNNEGEKVGSVVYKEEEDHDGIGMTIFTIKRYDLNDKLVFKSEWGDGVNKNYFINEKQYNKGLSKLKKILKSNQE